MQVDNGNQGIKFHSCNLYVHMYVFISNYKYLNDFSLHLLTDFVSKRNGEHL